MEDDAIFYVHLVHFTVFCYILWTFGIVRGNLVYFSHFSILYQEKSGNPDQCDQFGKKQSNLAQQRKCSCYLSSHDIFYSPLVVVGHFFIWSKIFQTSIFAQSGHTDSKAMTFSAGLELSSV
jgi:hypothetical protein